MFASLNINDVSVVNTATNLSLAQCQWGMVPWQ